MKKTGFGFRVSGFGAGALLFAALCAFAAHAEQTSEDPTRRNAELLPAAAPDEPLDTPAPDSQFTPPDGAALWKAALERTNYAGRSSGFFSFGDMVGEGFRDAKNFHSERYTEGDTASQLQMVIEADEARREKVFAKGELSSDTMYLTHMKLVYFIPVTATPGAKTPAPAPPHPDEGKAEKGSAAHKTPAASKPGAESAVAPGEAAMAGGRMIITAPWAEIDMLTNAGHATGEIHIEVYPQPVAGQPCPRIALLTAPKMRWKSWLEPSVGSTELVMYACQEAGESGDPPITCDYTVQPASTEPRPQPPAVNTEGNKAAPSDSTLKIRGYGLIYELGRYDRLSPVYDDDFRQAGLSTFERNRALLHGNVTVDMTATTFNRIVPFQGEEQKAEGGRQKAEGGKQEAGANGEKEKTQLAAATNRTLLHCAGPATLNLAAVPRPKVKLAELSEKELAKLENTPLELARRFEFLNDVTTVKKPLDAPEPKAGEADTFTHMTCAHLRLQYPPGTLPGPDTSPEYSEAIGGVVMRGYSTPAPTPEMPDPGPPQPFHVVCDRTYYDGPHDNLFLVGTAEKPATVQNAAVDAEAQQFNYRQNTQTMTMPARGPKRMTTHPQPGAPGTVTQSPSPVPPTPAPPPAMGGGDTTMRWTGPMTRQIVHIPVPQKPDKLIEILTLKNNVSIEQPAGGLKMFGDDIRIFRDLATSQVTFLEGADHVDLTMGETQAKGAYVKVDMAYDDNGQETKDIVTVRGDLPHKLKATVFKGGGTAVRADSFHIDRLADTLQAFGGAVAVVKAPPPPPGTPPPAPKPEAAQGAHGLMPTLSFAPGGDMFVQCDGEFYQDGGAHKVTIKDNVIIKQPGLTLLSDVAYLGLNDTPAPGAAGAPPAQPASQSPGGGLFSGDLKTVECIGRVELREPDKLIQVDRLFRDVANDTSLLEVNDPDNDVRVYMHDEPDVTKVLTTPRSLFLDGKTGNFTPGGELLIVPFRAAQPTPRDKEHSPIKRKKTP